VCSDKIGCIFVVETDKAKLQADGHLQFLHKGLVELTLGVNFINILRVAFLHADPKSSKNTVKLSAFFALLGSDCVKATRPTLMQLTPDY